MQLSINQLVSRAHGNSIAKGFWRGRALSVLNSDMLRLIVTEKLGLIVTEAAEGIEETREAPPGPVEALIKILRVGRYREDGKPEGLPSELADIVIRCFDLAGWLEIDLEKAITEKMAYNAKRPAMHGKAF